MFGPDSVIQFFVFDLSFEKFFACINITIWWTSLVQRKLRTRTTFVFTSIALTIGRAGGVERVFRAWTARVLPGVAFTIGRTPFVERDLFSLNIHYIII